MEMRQMLSKVLAEIMEKNEKVVVLDADLSKPNGTASLYSKFPNRCYNVGVAEQNMMGIAAGMASYGYIPVVVTFTPFATRRPCDQLTISVSYAQQNVKIIGTDPGITAELNGGTHMSVEDVGIVRSIPNILIYDAVDTLQLEQALPQIIDYQGAAYVRMPRKYAENVLNENYKFDLFKADVLREGKDLTIFATSILVKESLVAAEVLSNEGIDVEVINVHTIKPLDEETILNSLKKTKKAVVCENHNIIGGLFSAISELVVQKYPVPLKPIGIKDRFGQVGKLKELIKEYEMTSDDIVALVKTML